MYIFFVFFLLFSLSSSSPSSSSSTLYVTCEFPTCLKEPNGEAGCNLRISRTTRFSSGQLLATSTTTDGSENDDDDSERREEYSSRSAFRSLSCSISFLASSSNAQDSECAVVSNPAAKYNSMSLILSSSFSYWLSLQIMSMIVFEFFLQGGLLLYASNIL